MKKIQIKLRGDVMIVSYNDLKEIRNKYRDKKIVITIGTFDLFHWEHLRYLIDAKKLPKNCIWRYRKEGDEFTKFGGGKKKLKSYFIDQKIPQRLRDSIPLLACDNKIYVIAGVEISDEVKIDDKTKFAYSINIEKENK